MKSNTVQTGARIVLGLLFFVFGLNGFFQFIPAPPDMPEGAVKFGGALAETGYFFPLLKGTEVICGALLLSGKYVPLAMVVLSPIVVNIFMFHLVLTPGLQNLIMPLVIGGLMIVLAKGRWHHFKPLFQ